MPFKGAKLGQRFNCKSRQCNIEVLHKRTWPMIKQPDPIAGFDSKDTRPSMCEARFGVDFVRWHSPRGLADLLARSEGLQAGFWCFDAKDERLGKPRPSPYRWLPRKFSPRGLRHREILEFSARARVKMKSRQDHADKLTSDAFERKRPGLDPVVWRPGLGASRHPIENTKHSLQRAKGASCRRGQQV